MHDSPTSAAVATTAGTVAAAASAVEKGPLPAVPISVPLRPYTANGVGQGQEAVLRAAAAPLSHEQQHQLWLRGALSIWPMIRCPRLVAGADSEHRSAPSCTESMSP